MSNDIILDSRGCVSDGVITIHGDSVGGHAGAKMWIKSGKIHRIDGPAIEFADGTKAWYYHGKAISCSSQEGFERLLKLQVLW